MRSEYGSLNSSEDTTKDNGTKWTKYARQGLFILGLCGLSVYGYEKLFYGNGAGITGHQYVSTDVINSMGGGISNVLGKGETLESAFLESDDHTYRAWMQGDGNFVIYIGNQPCSYNAIYATGTSGTGNWLVMQTDNNLVIYSAAGQALWASGTHGQGTGYARLVMQNDGNLVIYDSTNTALWASGTMRCTVVGEENDLSYLDDQFVGKNNVMTMLNDPEAVKASEKTLKLKN